MAMETLAAVGLVNGRLQALHDRIKKVEVVAHIPKRGKRMDKLERITG
jgi:hypothetical protein